LSAPLRPPIFLPAQHEKEKQMKRIAFLMLAAMTAAGLGVSIVPTAGHADATATPIYVTKIPAGYRDWKLVSVAHEEGALKDIRAILANEKGIKAFREEKLPLPEGTIIARIAWEHLPSDENNKVFAEFAKSIGQSPPGEQSFIAGHPKNGVQFMVKDSKKYAATGGWGYAQFDDGKPADDKVMSSCFPCHQLIKARDYVFTRYAP
jgi:cytochrome P460